ncbi:MAG: oligopeptide/dipeptide transporter, ATPase subunit [Nocardioides sp.]|nr:oligopeptide/dipeptide transporter, ATPase subunit [Nocardioides sp.]
MATTRRARWTRALRTPVGLAASGFLAVVVLLVVLAPLVWGERAEVVDTGNLLQGSSAAHLFGTDSLGRDIGYRVLVATRLSVGMALLATVIGVGTGLLVGAAPVVLGRRTGRLVTGAVNVAVAFPALLLALFFATIFGVGARGAVLAVGLATAPSFARLTQTMVASVADRDFVSAARIAGVSRIRLLVRHVLPNIAEPLVVNATIGAGGALLAFSGLSFLGLGVQAPAYDWGRLLEEGLGRVYIHPEAAVAPAVALVVVGLAFNLVGETIAKGMSPRATVGRTAGAPHPPGPRTATGPRRLEPAGSTLLEVEDLHVAFPFAGGWATPVRGVSLAIRPGESVGMLGESGSGKSLTALAIARLLEAPASVRARRLTFQGTDLLTADPRTERELLGASFGMVFQDPMTSFNPTRPVGRQLAEVSQQHQGLTRGAAWARAVDRLREVRVPSAARRARQYPHEFSGGMLQRAMIGMGLMGAPALIVADEPTTALDTTVQREVLALLARIRAEEGLALLLISHDVTVVRDVCDRVLVMYAGRIVEELPTDRLGEARHPYTRALLDAVPDLETSRDRPLAVVPGRPVSPDALPAGCAFAARCPLATERCRTDDPVLADAGPGQRVACWQTGENLGLPAFPAATSRAATP